MAPDLLAMVFIISLVDPSCPKRTDQNQKQPTSVQNASTTSWFQTSSVTMRPSEDLRPTSSEDDLSPTSSEDHLSPTSSEDHLRPTSSEDHLRPTSSVDHLSPTSSEDHLSPTSSEDHLSQIQNQLENQTRLVVGEDEENFQDYEDHLSGARCQQDLLVEASHVMCGSAFHQHMEHLGPDERCILDNVIRAYNDMTLCLEALAHWAGCFYPNANIQDFFLLVHSSYFLQCSGEERHLEDAPYWLSVALTLGTVAVIPVLVYLVGWRSKVDMLR
uniref:uncharacterized protein LOC131126207 n=1 Tax=Doryrhamphus excisus TaxID=161450 RepID=UPI0025AE9D37|nr:uncharacterized protein LOC131126207 [Doryrhamphus excisus]